MATYAIGDVQGCFRPFMRLLEKINFNEEKDSLWLTGDIVNRGPNSLAVLRFVRNLKSSIIVLGNHDIHLLAVAYGVRTQKQSDTLHDILACTDKIDLIEWLRHQPLMYCDKNHQFIMAHAGIAPMWPTIKAKQLAQEVEQALQRDDVANHLVDLFNGESVSLWDDHLEGAARLRCIVNYFTRMRFCEKDGRLNFDYKGDIQHAPKNLLPWFLVPNRVATKEKIIFGHWAALNGQVNTPEVYALDTGCIWGNCLTAMRLEDGVLFRESCSSADRS